jgi:hypothetical protein
VRVQRDEGSWVHEMREGCRSAVRRITNEGVKKTVLKKWKYRQKKGKVTT